MIEISVIMPAYNEEYLIGANIERVINILNAMFENNYELIIVDDGSTDNTWKTVNRYKDVTLIRDPENKGKGAAFLAGVKVSQYSYIALLDSDLQIEPDDLGPFLNLMNIYNADVVIGNKRHQYTNIEYSLIRRLVSNSYNFLCRILFGIRLRDTQCGLKLFKRKALMKVIPRLLVKRFAADLELIVALKEKNIRVIDAPVNVIRRQKTGSVNWQNIIDTARDTLAVWYRKKAGWYR